jgi:hypothetical protein
MHIEALDNKWPLLWQQKQDRILLHEMHNMTTKPLQPILKMAYHGVTIHCEDWLAHVWGAY